MNEYKAGQLLKYKHRPGYGKILSVDRNSQDVTVQWCGFVWNGESAIATIETLEHTTKSLAKSTVIVKSFIEE